jgi:hypothetical protein
VPARVSQKHVTFYFVENCQPFGTVQRTSLDDGNIGHDWALIELDSSVPVTANIVIKEVHPDNDENHSLYITEVVTTGTADRKVLVVTGFHGALPGMMSKIPTYMMLPRGNSFGEVWTVKLEHSNIGEQFQHIKAIERC